MAHAAQRDLEGKNLTDYQDTRGKCPCREAAELSRKQGGGFLEFHWPRPGMVGEHRKLGYVEPIPGTNYWIGSVSGSCRVRPEGGALASSVAHDSHNISRSAVTTGIFSRR